MTIWGRVRPGRGSRSVQLQRFSGGSYVNSGARIATNPTGYFSANVSKGTYRFQAYGRPAGTTAAELQLLGQSRAASPIK